MKDFKGKVALITGGGNGIGAQLARDCAKRGMKIAIVDIHEEDAKKMQNEVIALGAEAIAITADVTLAEECKMAFDKTMEAFNAVDVLFNNAGVSVIGDAWELPLRDIEWIMQTNVMSHLHMLRHTVPQMIKQGTPCYIVNVASIAGLLSTSSGALYHTTKYAVVGLSEYLYKRLKELGTNIKVSVFCPGFIATEMYNTNRHRPERFKMGDDPYYTTEAYINFTKINKKLLTSGAPVTEATSKVWEAMDKEDFYILLDERYDALLSTKGTCIVDRKEPADLALGQVSMGKKIDH